MRKEDIQTIVFFESPFRSPFTFPMSAMALLLAYLRKKEVPIQYKHYDLSFDLWEYFIDKSRIRSMISVIFQNIQLIKNPFYRSIAVCFFYLSIKPKDCSAFVVDVKRAVIEKKEFLQSLAGIKQRLALFKVLYGPLFLANVESGETVFDCPVSLFDRLALFVFRKLKVKSSGEPSWLQAIGHILKKKGFSGRLIACFSMAYAYEQDKMMRMMAFIKREWPLWTIVLGGSQVTLLHLTGQLSRTLSLSVDFAIAYDGEKALEYLILYLKGAVSFRDCFNVVFAKDRAQAQILHLGYIEDLNSLPPPDYSLLILDRYYVHVARLGYNFSRGCSWGKCVCCRFTALDSLRYRTKSPMNVVDELQSLYSAYHISDFYFCNNNLEAEFASQLSDMLLARNTSLSWATNLRLDKSVSEGLFQKMRNAGCVGISFGVESWVGRINASLGKDISLDDVRRFLSICRKLRLKVVAHHLFGFPGESLRETLRAFLYPLFIMKYINVIVYHRLRIPPGCIMHDRKERYGIKQIMADGSFISKRDNWLVSFIDSNIVQCLIGRLLYNLGKYTPDLKSIS